MIDKIRNFSIIAHIDHGKSTLADRLIEFCGGLEARQMHAQVLDNMEIEKERGITIKAQTVRLNYRGDDGKDYILNLIDTPGHVDFSYEVSRSLIACEGSVLVVDASQGVEAQTLANAYHAIDANNEIIPVLNKIDLPAADPETVKQQITDVIGVDASDAIEISAKTGKGIKEVLESVITLLPPPEGDQSKPLKALLIDSWYDKYLGVVILVRVIDGKITKGMKINMMSNNLRHQVDGVGVFLPNKTMTDALNAGEVGFITTSIKESADCNIGDTITNDANPCDEALPGFKPPQSVVFCSIYPSDSTDFPLLKDSISKLQLNDSGFEFEAETSTALGFGFRCGFLGLLHLEIVQERLSREFDLDIITTAPSVVYQMIMRNGEKLQIHNPADMPDVTRIEKMLEPWIKAVIITPEEYLGSILGLCTQRRGKQTSIDYISGRVMVTYEIPLNEIVYDFYDRLKSYTKGYASFDWQIIGYKEADLVNVNILINHETIDAFSMILHKTRAETRGREIAQKLKELIPRHMFTVPIQAVIGGKIIARETISAMRKDVTAKCYGGDITRKRKLLEKQKAGKKKMRTFGKVDVPQGAFIAALKIDDKSS